nr:PAS domain S-box protein [Kiritimatiellia bacterium]
RSKLINSRFSLFVSTETRSVFNLFLDKAFENKNQETCEVTLKNNGDLPTHALLTVIVAENEEFCNITMVDITERKRAEEKILKLDRLYAVISQINHTIVRTSDRDKLFQEVCEIVIEYGKFQMSWIGLVDEETKFVNPVAFSGIEDGYLAKIKKISAKNIPEGRGPTGVALREGQYFVCDDIENDPIMQPWKNEALKRGYRSSIGLPIKFFGKVIGAFCLYSSTSHFFDQTEIGLLLKVTNDISFAIETIETEKKRVEAKEALRESEERLSLFFAQSLDGFFFMMLDEPIVWDDSIEKEKVLDYVFEHQRITKINSAMLEQYGATEEQYIGLTPADLFAHDIKQGRQAWKNLFDKGKLHIDTHEKKLDGSDMIIEGDYICLYDAKKRIIGHFGIQREVTAIRRADKLLRKSKNELKEYFENDISANYVVSLEGEIFSCNKTFLEMFGFENKSHTEKFDVTQLYKNPADRIELLRRVKQDGKVENYEVTFLTKDAKTLFAIINAIGIFNDSGELVQTRGYIVDITDRMNAEEQLKESERKFKDMANLLPQIIFETDENGILTYINEVSFKLFGYSEEDFSQKLTALQMIDPKDRDLAAANIQLVMKGAKPSTHEYTALRKDGSNFPVLIYSSAKVNDGRVLGLRGTIIDITERKKTEESLLKLSHAVEQSPVSILITDTDGNIEYGNPKAAEITGYKPEELIGKNPRIFKSGEKPKSEYQNLWNTISSGKQWFGEFHNKKKNGELYWEAASISPIMNDKGEIINYVAVKEDITARKKAEKEQKNLQAELTQAQKMESIGRLAGGVAHDFNNMLGVILGNTEMILEELDPAMPIFTDLEEIKKAAQRSADLTRQLLAFARKQTVSPEVLDLNRTLEGMLTMLRRLIGEDIDLAWLPGKNLDPIKIDPSQIDQLLANLCVNASDAIADVGKITIETSNAVFDEDYCSEHVDFMPGEFVMLTVSDNGGGMDQSTLDKIFEPFFTTKEQGKGTGLGLATIYGIVKQNKGFINVYSQPGQGTTFNIYLPRHIDKIEQIQEKDPAKPDVGDHETILLVEDESSILEMTTRMLEKLGYKVVAAGSPGEAIRLAREQTNPIHMLITDVVMPEMNGRDLTKNILTLYPNIKCLFMSGYTANVIAHQGVLDKGVNFIQKPFSIKRAGHQGARDYAE